jgi:hypothetical protein
MARVSVIRPGEERQRRLFIRLADDCLNHSMSDIQGAAVNLLLTAIQRNFTRQADAEARWDELMWRGKLALMGRFASKETSQAEEEIAGRLGV